MQHTIADAMSVHKCREQRWLNDYAIPLLNLITEHLMTRKQIVEYLNQTGAIPTVSGLPWTIHNINRQVTKCRKFLLEMTDECT